MTTLSVPYQQQTSCPLCGSRDGKVAGQLARERYVFGAFEIPLPDGKVKLIACDECGLVYKDMVPTREAMDTVMGGAATEVWRAKDEAHPLSDLLHKLASESADGILDIGAANGDVLRAVAETVARRSAFDIVRYPGCEAVVTGEYIVGQFEDVPNWSQSPYGVVTAFDVFEHFLDARAALNNIVGFVRPGGVLVIETGDTDRAYPDLSRWYYTNLFEHQVFWNAKSFAFFAERYAFKSVSNTPVNHKNRTVLPIWKQLAIAGMRLGGTIAPVRAAMRGATGVDTALLPSPTRKDHSLLVLQRS